MGGEDDVAEDDEARRRRDEGCRREEAIRGLLKRHDDKRLTIGAVEETAQELGVSRSTMYRLITAYRAKGTVSSVEPRALGRRKDTLVLDAKREKLIASTIHEIYLKPERPTMTYLIEQVRARCAQKGLPRPDRRTIKARVDRIDRRTVALKRKDAKGVKATKTVPGQYVTSRPLEVVQIDHTEVDVFLVDETTRKTMDKRPWLTLAIDVFTRMVVGFHLSMDRPSRVSLGLCMLNAVYDKSAWLTERGIDASWPLPDCLRPCTRTTALIFAATLLHGRAAKRALS
jgi:putative transposase